MKTPRNEDARVEREARREAQRGGYEYRPTSARAQREADRLNRGLETLEGYTRDGSEADED